MKELLTKPFKGILYNRNKIDDIAHVCVLPMMSHRAFVLYYERHPFNAIRLELPSPNHQWTNTTLPDIPWKRRLRNRRASADISDTVYAYEQKRLWAVDEVHYLRRGFIAPNSFRRNVSLPTRRREKGKGRLREAHNYPQNIYQPCLCPLRRQGRGRRRYTDQFEREASMILLMNNR